LQEAKLGVYSIGMNLKKSIALSILMTLVATVANASAANTWDLNDVSYIFPLPSRSTDATYLKVKDFIPYTWFTKELAETDGYPFSLDSTLERTAKIDEFRTIAKTSFDSVRLLAVRIDPCFQDLYSDPCRMQVRAIWQPIDAKSNAVDAAIHTFYDLNAEEFTGLKNQLQQLKVKYAISTQGLALQVHPGFKMKGFAADLFTAFKPVMSQSHLSRIAFMKLLGLEFQWRFQSFNLVSGALVPLEIPLRGGARQTFAVHGGGIPAGTLHLSEEDLSRARNGENVSQILLDYSLRVENPRIVIPGLSDCLSCHAVGGVKGEVSKQLGLNPIPTVASVVGLVGKYNLQNTSTNREDRIHFRAFGYVGKAPSMSDRVIIETALVADSLNR
jgi:hypothetical protein